jgi:hypothetical protein
MELMALLICAISCLATVQGVLLSLLAYRTIYSKERGEQLLRDYVFSAHDTIERLAEKAYGDLLAVRGHSLERTKRLRGASSVPGAPVVDYTALGMLDPDVMLGDANSGPQAVTISRG